MARENTFILFGRLEDAPVVLFNEESKTYRVTFILKTIRRSGRVDFPKVNIYGLDEKTAKLYVSKLIPGVYVEVRGMVFTKMIKKPVHCEKCGEISMVNTLQCEIISYGNPFVLKEEVDPVDIVEFANAGTLIGSVCTDVVRKGNATGGTVAQFQLAVNRRYRVYELEKGSRTDYPWIKAIGPIAEECLKRLRKSSQVFIAGAYQTRDVKRHVRCNHCGEQIVYSERVGEVLPSGVEFLNECLFDNEGRKASYADYEEKVDEKA